METIFNKEYQKNSNPKKVVIRIKVYRTLNRTSNKQTFVIIVNMLSIQKLETAPHREAGPPGKLGTFSHTL